MPSTSGTIRVSGLRTEAGDGWVERSALVEGRGRPGRLRFRFPAGYEGRIAARGDPFLAALLPVAVGLRRGLVVEAEVSARLPPQAKQVMELWNWRWPRREPVDVRVAGTCADRYGGHAVACFFSGGVDSFYTLLGNLAREPGDARVTHLICVLGFDLWHDNEEMFLVVLDRVRTVAAALQLEVVPVRTNLRAFTDPHAHWQLHAMGAGMAAVGLSLGPLLHRVLIPAGDTHLRSILQAPSNALLDPLFSTDSTEFVHDGCEAARLEKIRGRIAGAPLALSHLRVCLANHDRGSPRLYNCGRCPKCVRTMVALQVAGILERCTSFDADAVDPHAVRGLAGDTSHDTVYLEEVLAHLEDEQREPELQDALRTALRASRRLTTRIRQYVGREILVPIRRGLRRAWREATNR
jgi:hypothetical protein